MSERKLVGLIGVDAGLCWIGDPCYILDPDSKRPSTLGKTWEEFCDCLPEKYPMMKSFNYELGHEGLGCLVSTGFGDGVYPVYAEISDEGNFGKRIKSVTVVFIDD